MAAAWRWIFSAEHGPLSGWLSSPRWSMSACVLADVWKTAPFMALLLMAGLAGIPRELYEAASIDGLGPWRRFRLVTLPLLRPTIALAVLFRAMQSFGVFDLVWVLTGGGPGGRTRMIALYVYDTVFRYQELRYGCALSLVMAACLAGIAGLTLAGLQERQR
jgi:multiple sugar transport system permease protein